MDYTFKRTCACTLQMVNKMYDSVRLKNWRKSMKYTYIRHFLMPHLFRLLKVCPRYNYVFNEQHYYWVIDGAPSIIRKQYHYIFNMINISVFDNIAEKNTGNILWENFQGIFGPFLKNIIHFFFFWDRSKAKCFKNLFFFNILPHVTKDVESFSLP